MKTKTFFFLPLLIFSLWSCEREDITSVEESAMSAVILPDSFSAQHQEIIVQITTGTPCYSIDVVKTISDNIFEYDFTLTEEDIACVQVTKTHAIPVVFDPSSAGTYTLRFLINGEFYEIMEIVVTENSLVGTWQVLRFEDEIQNTVIPSPKGEEIVIRFGSSSFDGTTTRNEFQGEYQIQTKNKILITEYLTTEEAETEFGEIFNDAMRNGQIQALPFELNDNLLKINYEEGQYVVLSRL